MSAFCPHGYTPGPNHPCLFCKVEEPLRAELAEARKLLARQRSALEAAEYDLSLWEKESEPAYVHAALYGLRAFLDQRRAEGPPCSRCGGHGVVLLPPDKQVACWQCQPGACAPPPARDEGETP